MLLDSADIKGNSQRQSGGSTFYWLVNVCVCLGSGEHLEILEGLWRPAGAPIQQVDALAGQELLRQALAEDGQQRHGLPHDLLEVDAMCRARVPAEGGRAGQACMVLGLHVMHLLLQGGLIRLYLMHVPV